MFRYSTRQDLAFWERQQNSGKQDLSQATNTAGKYDNTKLTLDLIEKKANNDSGYWFFFAADFKRYNIPVLLCNKAEDATARVRWDKSFGVHISYKAQKPDSVVE